RGACHHHCREARGGWREGAGVRSRSDEGGQRHLREQDHAGRWQLRGAEGRRRAGHRDGVERVPRARLREDAQAAKSARDLRRAEHLQPRDHEGAGLHLLLDRTLMSRLRGILTDPLLSVVMPVYNEAATIEEMIRRVLAVPLRTQLIVVDYCSTDGTRDLLAGLQRELGFTLLLQPENRGKGSALRTG